MGCEIFNKSLILDANIQNAIIDSTALTNIQALIGPYNDSTSGIWQPIIIDSSSSTATYCEPLVMAGGNARSFFSPCNCSDSSLDVSADNALGSFQDSTFNCHYCGLPTAQGWALQDQQGNTYGGFGASTCCSGACDIRMKKDDYLPKIPVLDQTRVTGFLDFKYMTQFPACTNPGLGFERVISIDINNLSSFSQPGPALYIDWKLKETIAEIDYDKLTTQYDDEYSHNKALTKAKLKSQTCGNFLLTRLNPDYEDEYSSIFPVRLSGLIGSDQPNKSILVPLPNQFANMPYGFNQETYNNIFVKNTKTTSYWKWNYTSGILGWYRHYDTTRTNDTRPIPGVDLYISPGDVFFATNDGPEPAPPTTTQAGLVKTCPSGLKVIKNNTVDCIIPSGSEFMYISANIYEQFYNLYQVLLSNNEPTQALHKAAVLATAPQYDQVTVDLLKNNIFFNYNRNNYDQIDILNQHMSTTTEYDSVSDLHFINTKAELVSTLANKYGAYLWIPPNTSSTITFRTSSQSESLYLDLNFDVVMKQSDIIRRSACSVLSSCGAKSYTKSFFYDQALSLGSTILSTACFDSVRHVQSCNNGILTKNNFTNYCSLNLNNSRIKSQAASPTCITFQDNYRRIIDPNNILRYCDNCDTDSSYYLIPNADLSLCIEGNFCYKTLAKRFDPGLGLQERSIADNSLRLRRTYNARAFNPCIDLVAFHKDNGVFFRSKAFGSDKVSVFDRNSSSPPNGQPTISFTTQDVGIKIYHLYAEKLQSSNSTASCKRFPVNLDTCRCYGLNISDFNLHPYRCGGNTYTNADIFLPGLSTRHSPGLQKYGGYSQAQLNEFFGANVLTAGGVLTTLDGYIIPDQPYGCDRSVSISLRNYVNTEWSGVVINGLTTNHSDVTISVSEPGDMTASFARYVYDGWYFRARNNEQWKRFFTKVSLEPPGGASTTLWKDQTQTLLEKNSAVNNNYQIKLQNPYLHQLTQLYAPESVVLAPPSGDLISGSDNIFGQPVAYGDPGLTSRGDETSTVTLTFRNKPRKQILAFGLRGQASVYGSLDKGFFHPNSGLTLDASYHNKTPFKNNRIYYDEPLYADGYEQNGTILVGSLTPAVKHLFQQMYSFDLHRRARLYLEINGSWYEASIPMRGGFQHMGATYIGPPTYFEYVHHAKDTQNIPGMFPLAPKKHLELFFVGNHPGKFRPNEKTPKMVLFDKFKTTTSRTLVLPGSRYYFMIPELDPAISIAVANINSLPQMSDIEAESIAPGSMIKLSDNSRWQFVGNDVRSKLSYKKTTYGYLYHNFSDLHLNYNMTNAMGYVYNSNKKANQQIRLYNNSGNYEENTVLQKKLIAIYDRVTNRGLSTGVRKFQIFTVLELQNRIRAGYTMIDPLLISATNGDSDLIRQYSLTVFIPTLWLQGEQDEYLTSLGKTKWGDVLYYDNTILDPLTSSTIDESYWYPPTTYKNNFYKIIVNNHLQNQHRYVLDMLDANSNSYTIDHNDLVYYTIHQQYNTSYNLNRSYNTPTSEYHNYLPFMDINLLSTTQDTAIRSYLPPAGNTGIISGTVRMNSLYNELSNNHDWGSFIDPADNRFWIQLPSGTQLISAFVPTQTIYSPTLRIDDPIYWLSQTTTTTVTETDPACTRTFTPFVPTMQNMPNNSFMNNTMNARSLVSTRKFYSAPVFCDTDMADPPCGEQACMIKNIGSVSLSATWKAAQTTTLNLNSIPQNSIPYMLSYDAGHFNPFGTESLVQIHRFEITPDTWLDSENSCSSTMLKPSDSRPSIIDNRYQNNLTTVDDHAYLVTNTDSMANEILFRMLYGEKNPINRQILLQESRALGIKDFLSYSDPELTAKDVYKQILYNYDRNVTQNNTLYNSTLVINGMLDIGTNIYLTVGNVSIALDINRETTTTEDAVVVRGTIGSKTIYGKIYIEKYQHNSLIAVDGTDDAPVPASDDETFELVHTRTTRDTYGYYSYAYPNIFAVYSANGPGSSRTPIIEPNCVLLKMESGHTWIPNTYPAAIVSDEMSKSSIIFAPEILVASRPGDSGGCKGFDQCQDFEYAYCRRKLSPDCAGCPSQFESNDGQNFTYSFSACRHNNLSLYGHTYREKNTTNPISASTNIGPMPSPAELASATLWGPLAAQGVSLACGEGSTYPPSEGLAYGAWKYGVNKVDCSRTIVDPYGWCNWSNTNFNPGAGLSVCPDPGYVDNGPWTEYDVLKKCTLTTGTTRRIFHRKVNTILAAYSPRCPDTLCTITYNNYSVSITYPNVSIAIDGNGNISQTGTHTECVLLDNTQTSCPYINVDTLPDTFTIQENISSECSACNQSPLNITIPKQTQRFLTIREKRKCIIGTFVHGVIHPKPLITFAHDGRWTLMTRLQCSCATDQAGGAYPGQPSSVGWLTKMVGPPGQGSYPWSACLGDLDMWETFPQGGSYGSIPLPYVRCRLSVPSSMAEGPAAAYQLQEWKDAIEESYSFGGLGLENSHIPIDDIINGIIPGSQSSTVQYKTYTFTSAKARPKPTGGGEKEWWDVNVTVAYYDYEYVRPKTIQDILKPNNITCDDQRTVSPSTDLPSPTSPTGPDFLGQINATGQYRCWSLGFPSWFTLPGWPTTITTSLNLPSTFVLTKNYIEKNHGCTDSLRSYYRHSASNRKNNDWYAPPMICKEGDWSCWQGQADFGRVFLRAKTGNVW